ncbi:MAG: hypothetical protein SGILL_005001 [Bacillariaceae sp.]
MGLSSLLLALVLLPVGVTTATAQRPNPHISKMTALMVEEAAEVGNSKQAEAELHHGATTTTSDAASTTTTTAPLPDWVAEKLPTWGEELQVAEWQDDDGKYRNNHGWQGTDLVHDKHAPVRVLNYYVNYGKGIVAATAADTTYTSKVLCEKGGVDTTLTGIAHFTPRAESHKGYCHGGSMTSLLDDVIGWVAFLVTGSCQPWTGFTVQVNSKLQRPIKVNSILLVKAKITKVERRKVSVEASIVDPNDDDAVHASGTGLVVLNRGVLPEA